MNSPGGPTLPHPTHYPVTFWTTSGKIILQIFLGLAPLFLVTIRSWSSAVLILGSFLCLLYLLCQKCGLLSDFNANLTFKPVIVFTLLGPACAIAFSSMLRGKHVWPDYDSASRFLVAIAIFLFAIRERINIAKYLQYTAPSSLTLTLLHQLYFPQPKVWGPYRMSTYFADPLVFGYTSLTLGLISLISINLLTKDSKPMVTFKLLGTTIGFYLSVMSESRTGWLAVPFVITIWLYQQKRFKDNGTRFNLWAVGLIMVLGLGLLAFSSTGHQRWTLAFQELLDYSWVGIAPDTSIGRRITFLRIAFDMFRNNPIMGFGDTSNKLISLPPHIFAYAPKESLKIALTSGFHNEIVTNTIRFGIAGMVSTVMLFAIPLGVFVHQLRSASRVQQANSLIGVVFTLCVFISSLSTEVFDLKYMASFYALMIALLCASAIAAHEPKPLSHFAGSSAESNK